MTIDELAEAIRSYVGPPISPETLDATRWYIDIDSMTSDADIMELAEGIIRAHQEAIGHELGQSKP